MKPLDATRCPLSGTAIVEASAGTGKTFTICTLYARLVAERGLSVRDILVVTFTEAATAELEERIRSRLFLELDGLTRGDSSASDLTGHLLTQSASAQATFRERLRTALESFDQAAIFTIHGFCHRVLREFAFECEVDFEAELMQDANPLFDEIAKDFWANETYGMDPLLLRLIEPAREPGALSRILAAVAPRSWAEVLPEEAPVPDLHVLATFRCRLAELQATWRTERDAVARILREDPGLNRNVYRPTSVDAKLAEIDAYTSIDVPVDPAAEKGFLRKLTEEALSKNTKAKFTPPSNPFFAACTGWERARTDLTSVVEPFVLSLRRRFVDALRSELPRRKQSSGLQFFDDLLGAVDRALTGPRGSTLAARIRGQYGAALIDEFQDTDLVQYRIFQAIYGGTEHPLLLIGDPKQAIYAFRGADIFAYLAAVQDAPRPPTTLEVNWRSDPDLVRAVDGLFRRTTPPFLIEGIELPKVQARPGAEAALTADGRPVPPLQLRYVSAELSASGKRLGRGAAREVLPPLVARDITRLLGGSLRIAGRPIEPSDIAVLVRSNREAEEYQAALADLGVPSVSSHGGSVFKSPEAEELGRLLSALAEPGDGGLIRAALGTRLFGHTAAEIFSLASDEASWDAWVTRFRAWQEVWQTQGLIRAHRLVFSSGPEAGRVAVSTRLLGQAGGERCLTNHLHLAELLHRAEQVGHLGVFGLIRWFDRARLDKYRPDDSAELRLETDEATVKLVTIHKSKGLEYPVVYCPSLWGSAVFEAKSPRYDEPVLAYHDPDDAHRLKLELRDDERARALSERERRAEALRLTYVALTRAKHLCIVVTGNFEDLPDSALGYLAHHRGAPTDPWASTGAHIRGLDDASLWSETQALALSSGGSISASRLELADGLPYAPKPGATGPLEVSARTRRLRPSRVISSYSALIRGTSGREPNDRPVLDPGETALDGLGSLIDVSARSEAGGRSIPLLDFPRTSTAGSCFHAIYEELDFQDSKEQTLRQLANEKLALFGFDPDRWAEPVARAMRATLETPLESSPQEWRLADLSRSRRIDELPFLISARALSPQSLAEIFGRWRSHQVPANYVGELARLDFGALQGFLKGYVDLIFEREGQFFVVDYKSNFLGPQFDDYAPDALSEAMSHGHYFLQYHLYVVALHRYLTLRKENYDYERDFGGVYYLFIKGMSPKTGRGSGVFFDRPPLELVRALDAELGGLKAKGSES